MVKGALFAVLFFSLGAPFLAKGCCKSVVARSGRAGFSPAAERAPTLSTIYPYGIGAAGLKPRPSEALNGVLQQPLASGAAEAVPSGSTIHCRLSQTLNTKLNFRGDPFTATVTEPFMVKGWWG
jgi:hypothetical protein